VYLNLKAFLFFFLVLFHFNFKQSNAQEFNLKGKIKAEVEEVSFVNIINLTQKTGTISNGVGEFSIAVFLGDLLIFSAVQFERQEIKITEELIQNQPLVISLVEKNNFLQEVVVNQYGLTGNLEKDALQMPSYVFDYEAAGLKPPKKKITQTERRIYTATSSNIDYILNAINGRLKRLRKMQEWDNLETLKNDIRKEIPEEFFIIDLKIEKKYIDDFIYFCVENEALKSFVQNDEDLEVINYLSLKAEAYKILKANETLSH
jgi:hypothetical protein